MASFRKVFCGVALVTMAGCVEPVPVASDPQQPAPPRVSADIAARNFSRVVARTEPVAEAECRARTQGLNCDFQIIVDDRAGVPANAAQTVDRSGRPVIIFTVPLLADARNEDELAFVLGHEAAHHISQHIGRKRQTAFAGSLILGALAAAAGADQSAVQTAQDFGGVVGSRTYSKDFELEADALGTVIAYRAGYNPERGAAFFTRIPDPGNRFLGTHPPNASRIDTVRRTLASLR